MTRITFGTKKETVVTPRTHWQVEHDSNLAYICFEWAEPDDDGSATTTYSKDIIPF